MILDSISGMHAGAALGITAIISAAVAGWSNVKRWFSYFSGFFIETATLHDEMIGIVLSYLRLEYKRPPSMRSLFIARMFKVENDVIHSAVPFQIPDVSGSRIQIMYGPRGILASTYHEGATHLSSIRGLADFKGLIADAITYDRKRGAIEHLEDTSKGSSFEIIKRIGTAGDDNSTNAFAAKYGRGSKDRDDTEAPAIASASRGGRLSNSPYDVRIGVDQSFMYRLDQYFRPAERISAMRGLAYDDDQLKLIEYCEGWYRNARWYKDHFIPWKTGLLLHGPGGTGKSSFARVVGEIIGIPVYEFYMNTLRDAEFIDFWDNMRFPCVVLLDDFDTAFSGREAMTVHKSLSFETVLKQISGVSSNNGVLLVITTNHLEKIDDALGRLDENGRPTRPGRIDRVVHFGVTTAEQRRRLIDIILDDWTDYDRESLVEVGDGMTAAQFQSLCIEKAFNSLALSSNQTEVNHE